ncbi:MAG: GAF domain-containing protein, partial [Acidobacteriota bacterium]
MTEPLDLNMFSASDHGQSTVAKSDRQLLTTLFALGREVTSVLDLDELMRKLPELIGRITDFHAFGIYLLDDRQDDLRLAFSTGYPDGATSIRLKLGQGLVGVAAQAGRPLLANDVA